MNERSTLRAFQVLNIIGLILVLVVNYLAVSLPLGGKTTGELSNLYPNLFTPAGFTFSIWGIIYLGLAAFTVVQARGLFTDDDIPEYVGEIGLWFLLNAIANASWLWAWHYQYLGVSLVIMLAILTTLIIIMDKLGSNSHVSPQEYYGVRLPFQLYFGWITVATVANATAVLVGYGWDAWGLSPAIWTVILLLVVMGIGLIVLVRRRYYFYAMVLIWACLGIIAKRTVEEPQVISVVVTATGVVIALTIGLLYTRFRMN